MFRNWLFASFLHFLFRMMKIILISLFDRFSWHWYLCQCKRLPVFPSRTDSSLFVCLLDLSSPCNVPVWLKVCSIMLPPVKKDRIISQLPKVRVSVSDIDRGRERGKREREMHIKHMTFYFWPWKVANVSCDKLCSFTVFQSKRSTSHQGQLPPPGEGCVSGAEVQCSKVRFPIHTHICTLLSPLWQPHYTQKE